MEMYGPRIFHPPQRNCDISNNPSRYINENMTISETRCDKVTVCGDSDPWQSGLGPMHKKSQLVPIDALTQNVPSVGTSLSKSSRIPSVPLMTIEGKGVKLFTSVRSPRNVDLSSKGELAGLVMKYLICLRSTIV